MKKLKKRKFLYIKPKINKKKLKVNFFTSARSFNRHSFGFVGVALGCSNADCDCADCEACPGDC